MLANRSWRVLIETVLASLTGGFYLDHNFSHFINIVHLYTWITLVLSPLLIHLFALNTNVALCIYCVVMAAFFIAVKLFVRRLHYLFDHNDPIDKKCEEEVENPLLHEEKNQVSLEDLFEDSGAWPPASESAQPGSSVPSDVSEIGMFRNHLEKLRQDVDSLSNSARRGHSPQTPASDNCGPGDTPISPLPLDEHQARTLCRRHIEQLRRDVEALPSLHRPPPARPRSLATDGQTHRPSQGALSRGFRSASQRRQSSNVWFDGTDKRNSRSIARSNSMNRAQEYVYPPDAAQIVPQAALSRPVANHLSSVESAEDCHLLLNAISIDANSTRQIDEAPEPAQPSDENSGEQTGGSFRLVRRYGMRRRAQPVSRMQSRIRFYIPPADRPGQHAFPADLNLPETDRESQTTQTFDQAAFRNSLLVADAFRTMNPGDDNYWNSPDSQPSVLVAGPTKAKKQKSVYQLKFLPCFSWTCKISFDRIQLAALFDLEPSVAYSVLSVVTALVVGCLSILLLRTGSFHGVALIGLIFCSAGAQYALLKSVQPDPASPAHGFNHVILYSRPIFFCVLAAAFLAIEASLPRLMQPAPSQPPQASISSEFLAKVAQLPLEPSNPAFALRLLPLVEPRVAPALRCSSKETFVLVFYNVQVNACKVALVAKQFLLVAILLLPLSHMLGLLPQWNTLLAHVIEQLDKHVLGAQGSTGLLSASGSLLRGCLVCAIGAALFRASLHAASIYHSLSWGLFLALNYQLSRLPCSLHLYQLLLLGVDQQTGEGRTLRDFGHHVAATLQGKYDVARVRFRSLLRNIIASKRVQAKQQASLVHPEEEEGEQETAIGLLTRHCYSETALSRPNELRSWRRSHEVLTDSRAAEPKPASVKAPPKEPSFDVKAFHERDPLPESKRKAFADRVSMEWFAMLLHFSFGVVVRQLLAFWSPPNGQLAVVGLFVSIGFLLHYVWPHIRQPYPWLVFARPAITTTTEGRLCVSERLFWILNAAQKNLLLPLLVIVTVVDSTPAILRKFGPTSGVCVMVITSMKILRNGFSACSIMHMNVFLAYVLFRFDVGRSESFPVDFFFASIFLSKFNELLAKLDFIFVYQSPLQTHWGVFYQAFAQVLLIPRECLACERSIDVSKKQLINFTREKFSCEGMLLLVNSDVIFCSLGTDSMLIYINCLLSTLVSAPLEPFRATALFIVSYVRPVRFWEKRQSHRRADVSNLSMAAQTQAMSADQVVYNLNSILFEHLARQLQLNLAGDVELGRFAGGNVKAGDIFIICNEQLHFFLHFVETGNGLVTFQLRGLEFVGTFCHDREAEQLYRDYRHHPDQGSRPRTCCAKCCPVHCCEDSQRLSRFRRWLLLPLKSMLRLRWVTYKPVTEPYSFQAYALAEHAAVTTLQLSHYRLQFMSFFVRCIVYYTSGLENLSTRLASLSPSLEEVCSRNAAFSASCSTGLGAEQDPNEKFAFWRDRAEFEQALRPWARFCLQKNKISFSAPVEATFIDLCFALSELGRRHLLGADPTRVICERFLLPLHNFFKGDIRLSSQDDWVLADIGLLQEVETQASRMSLKLFQDQFMWEEMDTLEHLWLAIKKNECLVVICPETEPRWRYAVLNDVDHLFSFRRVADELVAEQFRIVSLNKKVLHLRVFRMNEESVRGFWAGQQREQISLRVKDRERGSIQSACQVLRNLINSSADQPIGYPIYVSPLITSFAGTNIAYRRATLGGEHFLRNCFASLNRSLFNRPRRGMRSSSLSVEMAEWNPGVAQGGGGGGGGGDLQVADLLAPSNASVYSVADSDISPYLTTTAAEVHKNSSGPGLSNTSSLERYHLVEPELNVLDVLLVKLSFPTQELMRASLRRETMLHALVAELQVASREAAAKWLCEHIRWTIRHRWSPNAFESSSRSLCHRPIVLLQPSATDDEPLPDCLCSMFIAVYEDQGINPVLHF